MKNYKYIELDINSITAYENNARTHDKTQIDQITESINAFGFTNPVLVDSKNQLIAGHGRIEAAKNCNIKKIPAIVIDGLSEEQQKALVIADNQLALNAGWDLDILKIEIENLVDASFDIELLGFDQAFIDDLLFEADAGLTDEDDCPPPPEKPVTVKGDLWLLGDHRLLCGDSNDVEQVNLLLDGVKPNAVVTDPPYGIGIDGQKKSKAKNPKHNRKGHEFKGWDSERPKKSFFDLCLSFNVPTVIWGGNYFADLLPPTRGWLYWSKGQDGLTMSDGELAWTTENKPLRAKTVNRSALINSLHPTQKPLEVIKFSINYLLVPQKGIVIDFFTGSGTTLMAAEYVGCFCYGLELDESYCDVIIQRWQSFTGKEAIHESGKTFNELKANKEVMGAENG